MENIFIFIGHAICHQIPDRSILLNGRYLPFCARCTGIYLGISISLAFLWFGKRLGSNKPFGVLTAVMASILLMTMAFDALTSYAGLRSTNNFIRIISGVLFGANLPMLYTLANNFKCEGKNEKIIVSNGEYLAVIVVGLGLAMVVYNGIAASWWLLSALLCSSMTVTFCAVPNFIFSNVLNIRRGLRYALSLACSTAAIIIFSVLINR